MENVPIWKPGGSFHFQGQLPLPPSLNIQQSRVAFSAGSVDTLCHSIQHHSSANNETIPSHSI